MVLGHGKHIGDSICSVIETFHISHTIVGRRSIADVKRLLVGSTSRYVVENASCNVAVVKIPTAGTHSSWPFQSLNLF
jgi:nucleotide-binding universal stress UspA family protein